MRNNTSVRRSPCIIRYAIRLERSEFRNAGPMEDRTRSSYRPKGVPSFRWAEPVSGRKDPGDDRLGDATSVRRHHKTSDIADGEHVVIHHALDRAPHRYPTSAIGHDLQPQAVTEASEMVLDIAFETAGVHRGQRSQSIPSE